MYPRTPAFSCTTTLPPHLATNVFWPPSYIPDTDPSTRVFDAFLTAIAMRISDALPFTLEQAYAGVDYGKKDADFTITLPRFILPGKTDELAEKVLNKVSHPPSPCYLLFLRTRTLRDSLNRMNRIVDARQDFLALSGQLVLPH